jgi:hypothetical protein
MRSWKRCGNSSRARGRPSSWTRGACLALPASPGRRAGVGHPLAKGGKLSCGWAYCRPRTAPAAAGLLGHAPRATAARPTPGRPHQTCSRLADVDQLQDRLQQLKAEQKEADAARDAAWKQLRAVVTEITRLVSPGCGSSIAAARAGSRPRTQGAARRPVPPAGCESNDRQLEAVQLHHARPPACMRVACVDQQQQLNMRVSCRPARRPPPTTSARSTFAPLCSSSRPVDHSACVVSAGPWIAGQQVAGEACCK